MKHFSILTILFASVVLMETSCKKQGYKPAHSVVSRTVQFDLFTDQDLSDDNHNITFTVFIEQSGNRTLWDSVLMPMKIKNIPRLPEKLVIEKEVSANSNEILKVGFRYSIENVGNSWWIDTSNAGATFKAVEFNFR